jgi:hypothetical protein
MYHRALYAFLVCPVGVWTAPLYDFEATQKTRLHMQTLSEGKSAVERCG